jgi:acyl-coenzyme A thioesterase PaaI-like protein
LLKALKKKITNNPKFIVPLFNLYRPFRGAGIKITEMASDFRRVKVEMPLNRGNKNILGTHFGGSLYAMSDPFFMFMLMQNLGKHYHVWDQDAYIEFKRPGDGTVYGDFQITETELHQIKSQASTGEKVLRTFETQIRKSDGTVVANVRKLLYIRLKKEFRPSSTHQKS